MLKKASGIFNRLVLDESGQGITEYAAILAFVAVLVGIAFTFKQPLQSAISNAFNEIVSALNAIS